MHALHVPIEVAMCVYACERCLVHTNWAWKPMAVVFIGAESWVSVCISMSSQDFAYRGDGDAGPDGTARGGGTL
jgi:hypothetical protein